MERKALSGVRIIDFGHVLAEPYGTMLLSYLGAEVIKVESNSHVDEQRVQTGGGVLKDVNASSNFFEINLNKKSITLNLKTDEGRALAKKLVATADVVTENMRPGVMAKNTLSYEDLKAVKEDIIYLSLSGYGQTGPYAKYAAYAPCFSCFGGQAELCGYEDGEPNNMTSNCDSRAGTAAAFAILMALHLRQKTGKGTYIDLTSYEGLNMMIGDQMMDYALNGRSPMRSGNRDGIHAPSNCYRCEGYESWISISVGTDDEWKALCRVMGDPEWTQDPKFTGCVNRLRHQDEMDAKIAEWTKDKDAYKLMEVLQEAGVAAMPSFNADQLYHNPQMLARDAIAEVDHPVIGKRLTVAPPFKLPETPAKIYRYAPLIGEHNEEVFCGILGLSRDEMQKLQEEQVIY